MNTDTLRDRVEAAAGARHPGCEARVQASFFAGTYGVELVVRAGVPEIAWLRRPVVAQHLLAARYTDEAEGVRELARALGVELDPDADPRDAELVRLRARVRELEDTLIARDTALRAVVRAHREAA